MSRKSNKIVYGIHEALNKAGFNEVIWNDEL